MIPDSCSNCVFMTQISDGMIIGQKSIQCRRYPPTGYPIVQAGHNGNPTIQFMYRHAETRLDNWCGEWALVLRTTVSRLNTHAEKKNGN